jgi:hypothetical protein
MQTQTPRLALTQHTFQTSILGSHLYRDDQESNYRGSNPKSWCEEPLAPRIGRGSLRAPYPYPGLLPPIYCRDLVLVI